MRFKHTLALAVVLTICVVPVAVSAGTAVNDVSVASFAQSSTTTTDTMGNDTMNDTMTTTHEMDDDMDNGTMNDTMTTTDKMDDGTMTDDTMTTTDTMGDDTMIDDNMSNDTTTDDTMNDDESGGSGNSLPGFGVGIAIVALAAGALFIARNR